MDRIRTEALDWICTHRNFPQLYSVGQQGFPIGRSTIFPVEDDWSITATGYRGNARVKQIANNPHLEALFIDTQGPWTKAVRIRGLGYHTDSKTLLAVYDEREDKARAKGEGFGERLKGQAIIDTVCCTHIRPVHVTVEGFDGAGSLCEWDIDPANLRPEPPRADGSEPKTGPTGFRQPHDMTIPEVSARALEWTRRQERPQHLYTIRNGFPVGLSAPCRALDDWTTEVTVPAGDPVLQAVAQDPRVEVSWIDASHEAAKNSIPTIVFLRGLATAATGAGGTRVIRVKPTRIRTEGFGKGLQLYVWNV
jgi:hypothetical protein